MKVFLNYDFEDVKLKYKFEGEDYILYLGRIHPQKGILELLKAFYLISQKFSSIHLILVGPDNGYLKEVEDFIESFKLKEKIKWIPTLLGIEKYKIISRSNFLYLLRTIFVFLIASSHFFSISIYSFIVFFKNIQCCLRIRNFYNSFNIPTFNTKDRFINNFC